MLNEKNYRIHRIRVTPNFVSEADKIWLIRWGVVSTYTYTYRLLKNMAGCGSKYLQNIARELVSRKSEFFKYFRVFRKTNTPARFLKND